MGRNSSKVQYLLMQNSRSQSTTFVLQKKNCFLIQICLSRCKLERQKIPKSSITNQFSRGSNVCLRYSTRSLLTAVYRKSPYDNTFGFLFCDGNLIGQKVLVVLWRWRFCKSAGFQRKLFDFFPINLFSTPVDKKYRSAAASNV